MKKNVLISIQDICAIGVMTALLLIGKQAQSFLPNVEIVSLLIILYTLTYRKKVLYVIYIFVWIQGILYGFGLWFIMYLYVWTILAALTHLLRKWESVLLYAFVSALYGLCFGALCAIPYLFIGGWQTAFAWWIAGIPYDIIHCVGNFVVCLVLFKPLRAILKRIHQ